MKLPRVRKTPATAKWCVVAVLGWSLVVSGKPIGPSWFRGAMFVLACTALLTHLACMDQWDADRRESKRLMRVIRQLRDQ